MQALVLVGGKGTRLRPLTNETPKPVLPLAGRPFLGYMVEWLQGHGVEHIVFACGFLPDRMREVLGDGVDGGPRFTWVVERDALGTAGAMRHALDHLDGTFLALNGDSLADLDLTALWNRHRETGARATLGLYPMADPSAYGLVDLAPDGQVRDFLEKPDGPGVKPGLVSAGIYVLDRDVIAAVSPGRSVSIEHEVFPALAGNGLYGLVLDGYWKDIGTPERFLEATWDIIEGRVQTAVPVHPEGLLIDPETSIHPAARIGPRAVIGPGCEIGPGASVARSVLLDGVVVGAGATVADSIFSPGVNVADNAIVEARILGRNEAVHA